MMKIEEIEKKLEDFETRISLLEKDKVASLDTTLSPKVGNNKQANSHSGPKGGVILLVEEGFFKTKKNLDEVWAELGKKGYVYKKDVVRIILTRLSKPREFLVKIQENGKNIYVQRK